MGARLLTVREAAAEYKLHRRTLYDWVRKGAITHVRVGPRNGAIRLRESDLIRLVREAGAASPAPENDGLKLRRSAP